MLLVREGTVLIGKGRIVCPIERREFPKVATTKFLRMEFSSPLYGPNAKLACIQELMKEFCYFFRFRQSSKFIGFQKHEI